MSKAVAPRDTKLDSGTQLTESNLSSIPGLFRERSPQTVPFQIRQAHNMLGSGIWAGDFRLRNFHEAIGSISTLEKRSTSLFQALKRKTRLDQIQLARALCEKGGRNFFLATRECCLGILLALVLRRFILAVSCG